MVHQKMGKAMQKSAGLVIASLLCVWVVSDWWPALFQPATATRASETQAVPERRHRPDVALDRPVPVVVDYTDHMDSTDRMDHADVLHLNRHLISVADKVRPTVVNISVTKTVSDRHPFFNSPFFDDPFFRRFFGERFREERRRSPRRQRQGTGSGVIVSADGYIVTNNHVVAEDSTIQVVLDDKRTFEAELIGTDPKTDLAIVKIDASGLPFLSWGDSSQLHVGEMVIAVGNPFGLNQTVTMGIISAVGRANVGIVDYEDFIQTDAAINPGNSGGALVNLQGDLIGINTAIFSRSGGYMGIGFAIPSNMAHTVTQSLKMHGKVVRGWLGVSIQDLTPELAEQFDVPDTNGALVTDVVADSPAQNGDVQRGDVIRDYDGHPVDNSTRLRTTVAETTPGTGVAIGIVREGREQTLSVVIGQMPGDMAGLPDGEGGVRHALSGLTVETVPPGRSTAGGGVRVTNVDPDSRAARSGIRKNDHILEINRIDVRDVEDFNRITSQLAEDDSVLVLLRRGRAMLFFSVGRN